MSDDLYDVPELKRYLEHARREMFPKLKDSVISITIAPGDDPDPKICLELGAAILFDKPIIIVCPPGRPISANLKRVANAIVVGDMSDPTTGERMHEAIERVMANDARAKGPKQ